TLIRAQHSSHTQRARDLIVVLGIECRLRCVDDAVPGGEQKLELLPAALPDDSWRVHISRAVLRRVAIKQQPALLIDGIDDSVAAGEQDLELLPPALPDHPRRLHIAGPVLVVVLIEEELALLIRRVDISVTTREEKLELLPAALPNHLRCVHI